MRRRYSHGARGGLLAQESQLPSSPRAGEYYRMRLEQLIARGALDENQAVPLASLGLLRSADAGKRIGELSIGQQRRLELALTLAARPSLLLLDEPSNHLSITLVDELTEALRSTEAAVILASHDRQLLRDVADWPMLALAASPPLLKASKAP